MFIVVDKYIDNIWINSVAVGIDHIPELVEMSQKNIESDQPELIRTGRIQLKVGDGRLGYPELGPYNAIHVGAAAAELPQPLVDQLKVINCLTFKESCYNFYFIAWW